MNKPRSEIEDDDQAESDFDLADSQEDRLALQLCQVSELLQHDKLEVMEGLSDVYHNPVLGVIKIKVDFLLRHRNAKDEIDLNVWNPDEESFMVKVMTRGEAYEEERKYKVMRYSNMILWFLLFNAGFIIAKLQGLV